MNRLATYPRVWPAYSPERAEMALTDLDFGLVMAQICQLAGEPVPAVLAEIVGQATDQLKKDGVEL